MIISQVSSIEIGNPLLFIHTGAYWFVLNQYKPSHKPYVAKYFSDVVNVDVILCLISERGHMDIFTRDSLMEHWMLNVGYCKLMVYIFYGNCSHAIYTTRQCKRKCGTKFRKLISMPHNRMAGAWLIPCLNSTSSAFSIWVLQTEFTKWIIYGKIFKGCFVSFGTHSYLVCFYKYMHLYYLQLQCENTKNA